MDSPPIEVENAQELRPISLFKDVVPYGLAILATILVAVPIYLWWMSLGAPTSALPPLLPGQISSYSYVVQEKSPSACVPGNGWDGCSIIISRDGEEMWNITGMKISQHLGGLPLRWLDDQTLVTGGQSRSGPLVLTDHFYLYHPETNTKDFYYETIQSKETGPTILRSWYLYNSGPGEYDYAAWLYRSSDNKAIIQIASRPSVHESWCPSFTGNISPSLEKCFLSITPYWTPAVGPLTSDADAENYSVSFEREPHAAVLIVHSPAGDTPFNLDIASGTIRY